jgi:hypothetical protein
VLDPGEGGLVERDFPERDRGRLQRFSQMRFRPQLRDERKVNA